MTQTKREMSSLKRRENARALQSFAKREYAFSHISHEVLLECGESSHRFTFSKGASRVGSLARSAEKQAHHERVSALPFVRR